MKDNEISRPGAAVADRSPTGTLADLSRCPLCGEPNACSLAGDTPRQETCWCVAASFSRALLDSVPDSARGKICICASCAQRATTP